MWARKLYGADAERYFGYDANVCLAACILSGLTRSEGSALLEVRSSPEGEAGLNATAHCHVLTPGLAAEALRDLAEGVFSSFKWDDCNITWIWISGSTECREALAEIRRPLCPE